MSFNVLLHFTSILFFCFSWCCFCLLSDIKFFSLKSLIFKPVRYLVIQHPFSNKWILFCIVAHGLNHFILTRFYLKSIAVLVLIDMMIKYTIVLLHWSIIVLVFSFDELTFYICPSLWWILPLLSTFRKVFQQCM